MKTLYRLAIRIKDKSRWEFMGEFSNIDSLKSTALELKGIFITENTTPEFKVTKITTEVLDAKVLDL